MAENMKIIRISTDMEMTVHDYPSGTISEQSKALCELIGNWCNMVEHVRPMRLYTKLGVKPHPTETPGECVCMLVDEEGAIVKGNTPNPIGSYLYESDRHHNQIMGNILLVGETYRGGVIDFCGIDDRVMDALKDILNEIIQIMRA